MKRMSFYQKGMKFIGVSEVTIQRLRKRYEIIPINIFIEQEDRATGIRYTVHYSSDDEKRISSLNGQTVYFFDTIDRESHNRDKKVIVYRGVNSVYYKISSFRFKQCPKDTAIAFGSIFLMFNKRSKELANFKMRYG